MQGITRWCCCTCLPSYFSMFEQMFSLGKKCKTHYTSLEGMTGMKELFALCCCNILKFSDKVAFSQPCFAIIQRTPKKRCTVPISNSATTHLVFVCVWNSNIPRLSLISYFLFSRKLTYKALRHYGLEMANISISVRHWRPFLNWLLYCKHMHSK